MKSTSEILLQLSLIPGIGPVAVHTIFTQVADLSEIYNYTKQEWAALGFPDSKAALLMQGLKDHAAVYEELALLEKHKIQYLTLADAYYPDLLKHTYAPPAVLYWQGNAWHNFTEKTLAIVGARKSHTYAKLCANMLVPELVHQGWHIVSGGALGADTFAHEATLQAHGKTTAILGSGLLHWYPLQNKKLFSQIQEQGMLISIFPLRTQPLQGNFPARNRVIAGLSSGCLLLQAEQKSGALITAKYALEYGRQVFAVPGPIQDSLSYGSHYLIQQGASLVSKAQDILQAFGTYEVNDDRTAQSQSYDKDSDLLVHMVSPVSLQRLFEQTHIPMQELQERLFNLLLEGKIGQNSMGFWQKI